MNEPTTCIFCKLLAGETEVSLVYQDNVCSAFMDIQPVNPGHVLVVPNRHAPYLGDLNEEEGTQIFRTAQRIAAALRRSGVKCEGINFFLADGQAAMQEVFHAHLHVFPRYKGDGFGLKFSPTYFQKPERKELESLQRGSEMFCMRSSNPASEPNKLFVATRQTYAPFFQCGHRAPQQQRWAGSEARDTCFGTR